MAVAVFPHIRCVMDVCRVCDPSSRLPFPNFPSSVTGVPFLALPRINNATGQVTYQWVGGSPIISPTMGPVMPIYGSTPPQYGLDPSLYGTTPPQYGLSSSLYGTSPPQYGLIPSQYSTSRPAYGGYGGSLPPVLSLGSPTWQEYRDNSGTRYWFNARTQNSTYRDPYM